MNIDFGRFWGAIILNADKLDMKTVLSNSIIILGLILSFPYVWEVLRQKNQKQEQRG